MRKTALILLFSLALLTVVGCGTNSDSFKTFSNKEVEFSYPKDWQPLKGQGDSGFYQAALAIYGAPVEPGNFQPNVNLAVQTYMALSPSAQELAEQTEQFFKLMGTSMGLKDYEQISYEPAQIGNIKAGILVGDYTISQTDTKLRSKMLIVPFGQKAYMLTVTSTLDQWEEYKEVFEQILSSFQFTK